MKKAVVLWTLLFGLMACTGVSLAREQNIISAVIDGKAADRVHLREKPSKGSRSLGVYYTGTQVTCDPNANREWIWVVIGTQGGYMQSEDLFYGSGLGSVSSKQPTGIVDNKKRNSWVNLRAEPSAGASVIREIDNGNAATILGETANHWYYVSVDDQKGYMMSNLVILGSPAQSNSHGQTYVPSLNYSGQSVADAFNAYKAVMLNGATYTDTYDDKARSISNLLHDEDDNHDKIEQFLVMDLDRDGIPALLLQLHIGGYEYATKILHYQDGVVYGYLFGIRQFSKLKTDGTFSYNDSSSDFGFCTVEFNKRAYAVNKVAYSERVYDAAITSRGVSCFINGQPATDQAFYSLLNKQYAKQDAPWIAYSTDNVEAVLSYPR